MKIDLEDLRAELNDFSPEQQREKEIKTIERSMVALTNVTSELGKYLTQMEHLAWEINWRKRSMPTQSRQFNPPTFEVKNGLETA